jgi:hypothetical protein
MTKENLKGGFTKEQRDGLISAELKELPEKLQQRVLEAPMIYRVRYLRALSGKEGLANAVRVKCLECCGFEDAKARVRDCRVLACPLHFYRPYKGGGRRPLMKHRD